MTRVFIMRFAEAQTRPSTVEVKAARSTGEVALTGCELRPDYQRDVLAVLREALQRAGLYSLAEHRSWAFEVSGAQEGDGSYELPGLALGCLVAALAVEADGEPVGAVIVHGDLDLRGRVRPALGLVSAVRRLDIRIGADRIVLASVDSREHRDALGPDVRFVAELEDIPDVLLRGAGLSRRDDDPVRIANKHRQEIESAPLLEDIRPDVPQSGNLEFGAWALQIAVAGDFSILFKGRAGSGRTMLARRAPGLRQWEPSAFAEAQEVYSRAMGVSPSRARRPFRAPHHTCSLQGLLGTKKRAGEVYLAHGGVLFLDEITEFPPAAVAEVFKHYRRCFGGYQIVSGANPCPCGYGGTSRCTCDADTLKRYMQRLAKIEALFDIIVDLNADDEAPRHPRTTAEAEKAIAQTRRLLYDEGRYSVGMRADGLVAYSRVIHELADAGEFDATRDARMLAIARVLAVWDRRTEISSDDLSMAVKLSGISLD